MKTNIEKSFIELIYLLHFAINKESVINADLAKSFDYKEIYLMSKSHSVSACVYNVIKDLDIDINIKKAFEQEYVSNLRKTMLFDAEYATLTKEFSENNIYYVPLKGINLKKKYSVIGARQFADFDILFDETKANIVKNIFIKKGYEVETYNSFHHDAYQKAPFFNFEMHRTLFDPIGNTKVFEKYYKNTKDKLIQVSGYEYKLSLEDEYIYFICHGFKHYTKGGNGVRFLVDIYAYLYQHNNMNKEYVIQEFEKLNIKEWYLNLESLVTKIFISPINYNDNDLSIEDENELGYILNSGTYGTIKNGVYASLNTINKNGKPKKLAKFRYIVSRICISRAAVRMNHPFIAKTIIFIPLVWVGRIFKALFNKKAHKNMKNEMKYLKEYGK